MTFGEKLQALRKAAGLSQEELAEKISVTRQSVSKWENSAVLPETETLLALSRLFGVSIDALLSPEPLPAGAEEPPQEDAPCRDEAKTETAPQPEESAPDAVPGTKRRRKRTLLLIALLAAAAALLAVLAAGIAPAGRQTPAPAPEDAAAPPPEPVKYFCVLVHGMGGWGDESAMNDAAGRYWGADAGDLAAYLRGQGYEVRVPTVGPISSAWDRACELYAQLTGTRVDYGAAHAAACGHERYGRTYTEPLIPEWGARHRADLIGHSFGGETVRLLASLLTYGDDAEKAAGAEDLSPLFEGGHGDLVRSVTALCSPHNGSSLTCMVDTFGKFLGLGSTTQLLARLCLTVAGSADSLTGVYDFMLDQFGIGSITGGLTEITDAIGSVFEQNDDNAGYDLSPDGAAKLNARIGMNENVYYLSYAYCTTEASGVTGTQKPIASTLPVLAPLAVAMGSYTGTSPGGIRIDDAWRPNDGLVNVVSAQFPAGSPHADWNGETPPQKGIWNVAPVKTGHHGTVIGLGADPEATRAFYTGLLSVLDALDGETPAQEEDESAAPQGGVLTDREADPNVSNYGRTTNGERVSQPGFGYGTLDYVYTAVDYFYRAPEIREKYGEDFVLSAEDVTDAGCEYGPRLYGLYEGTGNCEIRGGKEQWYLLTLEKTRFGKWQVVSCEPDNDYGAGFFTDESAADR